MIAGRALPAGWRVMLVKRMLGGELLLPPPLQKTLVEVSRIGSSLEDDWWVIGSAAIALLGIEIEVQDVDLLVSRRDAETVAVDHSRLVFIPTTTEQVRLLRLFGRRKDIARADLIEQNVCEHAGGNEPAIESGRVMDEDTRRRVGENVVLGAIPPGLLDGLPTEDQRAIRAIVGKPVMLAGYDDSGRAELQFADSFDVQTGDGSHTHSIWVAPEFIKRDRSNVTRELVAFTVAPLPAVAMLAWSQMWVGLAGVFHIHPMTVVAAYVFELLLGFPIHAWLLARGATSPWHYMLGGGATVAVVSLFLLPLHVSYFLFGLRLLLPSGLVWGVTFWFIAVRGR